MLKFKKLKDGYLKLTLFKVWISFYKHYERWEIINEVFPKKFESHQNTLLTCVTCYHQVSNVYNYSYIYTGFSKIFFFSILVFKKSLF
jgi:hypothetical protein